MSTVAGLFGGRTGRDKRLDTQFENAFTPLVNQQTATGSYATGAAKGTLDKASSALDPSLDFWKSIVQSPDTSSLMKILGPEFDTIGEQSAANTRATSEFAPRGGRRNEMLGTTGDAEGTQLNKILLGLRPEAAGQLSSLAQLLFGAGVSELNAGTGAQGNALQALLGSRSANLQERGQRYGAVGNLLSTLIG